MSERKWQQSESGLVRPTPKPEKPPREYGPLELRDGDDRKVAAECFQKLMGLTSPGPIQFSKRWKGELPAIQEVILSTALLVLGPNFSWEELT